MPRFDLYTHVHKAVRLLLFDALETVARTDFRREGELEPALEALRRTLRLTQAHAQHEDREVHPLLHRLAPELAADLETGHDRFEGLGRELAADLARIEDARPDVRVALGRRLQERLGGLVADQLVHMSLEETRANRILWAHLPDEELRSVQARIVAAIGAAELAEWVELLVAGGNLGERAELLAGLRVALAPEAFVQATARARAWVGESRWRETLAAAEELAGASAVPA